MPRQKTQFFSIKQTKDYKGDYI